MKFNIFKKLFCSVTLTIGVLPIISLISCNKNNNNEIKGNEDNSIVTIKPTKYKIQGEEEVLETNIQDPEPEYIGNIYDTNRYNVEIVEIGYNEYASGKVRALRIPKNAISLPKQIDPKINSIAYLLYPNESWLESEKRYFNLQYWDVSNVN